jgi:hypothetical protein
MPHWTAGKTGQFHQSQQQPKACRIYLWMSYLIRRARTGEGIAKDG